MLRLAPLLGLLALALPSPALAYGWPLKPFDEPHPIRGFFDDPRVERTSEELSRAFHFGVDIAAPDGTPVYAVEGGTVDRHRDNVAVTAADGRVFGYWHIDPLVRDRADVRTHQLMGRIRAPWEHVHFAESIDGAYVNPLRRGGLTPYVDDTPPTIEDVLILAGKKPADIAHVTGAVDLVTDAYDAPSLEPPGPWRDTRLTPVLVRWRVLPGPSGDEPWQVAADFRFILLPNALFSLVYAPGTRENRADRPGRYRFYLAQGFDSTRLPNGFYRLEVAVSDTAGNTTTSTLPFRIANGQ